MYGGKDVCKPTDWLTQYQDASKKDLFNVGIEAVPVDDVRNMTIDNNRSTMDVAQSSQRATRTASSQQQPMFTQKSEYMSTRSRR